MARLLIIDDEKLARITLRKILESAGHHVVEASNGSEGIAMYRANPTDLVITDIIMPDKEGVETIIELKRDFPDIRIIAVSGGGRTRNLDFLKLAQENGAQHVLAKPFSRQELIGAVNSVLTGSPQAGHP
jgi:YesN/AraC family two-component response regulator